MERPAERGQRIEQREAPPRVAESTGAERNRGPAPGDETGDDDHLSSPRLELALGPVDALARLLAAEEAFGHARAEAVSDQVGEIVAEKGSGRGGGDDRRQLEIPACCDDTRRDHGGFARDDRHQRIQERQQQHYGVRPARRVRHEVGELLEHRRYPSSKSCANSSRSGTESRSSSAPSTDSSCSGPRGPTTTAVTCGWLSTQATASVDGSTPRSAARATNSSRAPNVRSFSSSEYGSGRSVIREPAG